MSVLSMYFRYSVQMTFLRYVNNLDIITSSSLRKSCYPYLLWEKKHERTHGLVSSGTRHLRCFAISRELINTYL